METRFQAPHTDRLDKLVATGVPALTRSAAQKLIEAGHARVGGVRRAAGDLVRAGEWIEVHQPDPEPVGLRAEDIALDVLFEDASLLVINKPAGMVVHPGAGIRAGTVANALLRLAPEAAQVGDDPDRPGIAHRLDKETSGVLLIAKTDAALRGVQAQFKNRTVRKTYLAICVGDVIPPSGLIDRPIGRDPGHRQRMAIVAGGRPAQTEYLVTERVATSDARRWAARLGRAARLGDEATARGPAVPMRYSVVRARPLTGRTHQIRVHLASIGFPIVGDATYGATRHDPLSRALAPRQLLHASELRLRHPLTGAELTFVAPLPGDMALVLSMRD